MPSPRDRALGITEVLELILSYLDERDILVNAQRVSKHWRDAVEESIVLQRALFFQRRPDERNYYTPNSLIAHAVPSLFQIYKPVSSFLEISTERPTGRLDTRAIRNITGWLADGASWRRMQIAQPSVTKVWMVLGRRDSPSDYPLATIAEFEFPEGLCMGAYHDLVAGTRGRHYTSLPNWVAPPLPPTNINHMCYPFQVWPFACPCLERAAFEGALLIWKCRSWRPEDNQEWHSVDLRQYRVNLRRLEMCDYIGGRVRFSNLIEGSDTTTAMENLITLWNE